jgi:hypothetical protein
MKEELELLTLVLVFICIKNKVRKWGVGWGGVGSALIF